MCYVAMSIAACSVGGLSALLLTIYLQNLLPFNPVFVGVDIVGQDGCTGPCVQAVVPLQMLQNREADTVQLDGEGGECKCSGPPQQFSQ